ncbi:unnamed protein product [Vicia faba]|uniref:Uncharacterized protein n=1 Tax=Vicia faba TaxID=3906 RepID=A0AAV0YDH8_VICFA|nr:unnamed protein product [Vicia faba]
MSSSSFVSKGAGDFIFIFSSDELICIFLEGVGVSYLGDKDHIILEDNPIGLLPSLIVVLLLLSLPYQRHEGFGDSPFFIFYASYLSTLSFLHPTLSSTKETELKEGTLMHNSF